MPENPPAPQPASARKGGPPLDNGYLQALSRKWAGAAEGTGPKQLPSLDVWGPVMKLCPADSQKQPREDQGWGWGFMGAGGLSGAI